MIEAMILCGRVHAAGSLRHRSDAVFAVRRVFFGLVIVLRKHCCVGRMCPFVGAPSMLSGGLRP